MRWLALAVVSFVGFYYHFHDKQVESVPIDWVEYDRELDNEEKMWNHSWSFHIEMETQWNQLWQCNRTLEFPNSQLRIRLENERLTLDKEKRELLQQRESLDRRIADRRKA